MAIGAFPLVKLGALALRQISKPLANHLKKKAKTSNFVRTKICMPPAQLYHYLEVNVKTRLLNLGKPKEVVKLNEQAAIELGSDIIGEMLMFVIAAATVVFEYSRQSRKIAAEKENLESRLQEMEAKLVKLELSSTKKLESPSPEKVESASPGKLETSPKNPNK